MPRPSSVFGLSRELARTYWQRLGRGWKVGLIALLIAGATGVAVSGMFSCPSSAGGCPYSSSH